MKARLIVGISGATGSIYARRLLEVLKASDQIETHLVISKAGKRTLREETPWRVEEIESLAHFVYEVEDSQARILDNDFEALGMVVIPCSVKSMAAIALSTQDNLLIRAANVILQTGRKLVLVIRETPVHIGHIKIMLRLAEAGAILLPPIPTFEQRPKTVDDLVDQVVHRVLRIFKT
ncbi:MAG TPA: UbiX family flavin prenyltransferase [Candidatus Limnocylindrales bacterium]|nr:UbiX family flavin prenyltransferase [Candidatus Limnocylindrales bacterium]